MTLLFFPYSSLQYLSLCISSFFTIASSLEVPPLTLQVSGCASTMHFLNNVWTSLVWLGNCLTLSPFEAPGLQQYPLDIHSEAHIDVHKPNHPIFKPPGGQVEGPDSDFVCEYPAMPEWEPCSSPSNRECWLRHPNGTEFNIHTDYEISPFPVGITRNYTLVVTDGWINADGKNFTEAKLFNNQFPGPWIQACWGDVRY